MDFGVNANKLRKRIHIPIIDDYMKGDGYRWESDNIVPIDSETLHWWKKVQEHHRNGDLLSEESDAYRKNINDVIFQLNIHSIIINDSISSRRGNLFLGNTINGRLIED